MTALIYKGEPFLYPHENEAFERLCSAGAKYLPGNEDLRIIGNVKCNQCQMDALVFTSRSITIIDFKSYGGYVEVTENNKWFSEDVEIKGGNRFINPFAQVKCYKSNLMRWFETRHILPTASDLGHISGLVMFTQPI